MAMLVQLQSSHFLHKIYFNTLPLGEVVIGSDGNLQTRKLFRDQSFITMEWHGTCDKILNYILFPLPPFSTTSVITLPIIIIIIIIIIIVVVVIIIIKFHMVASTFHEMSVVAFFKENSTW